MLWCKFIEKSISKNVYVSIFPQKSFNIYPIEAILSSRSWKLWKVKAPWRLTPTACATRRSKSGAAQRPHESHECGAAWQIRPILSQRDQVVFELANWFILIHVDSSRRTSVGRWMDVYAEPQPGCWWCRSGPSVNISNRRIKWTPYRFKMGGGIFRWGKVR